MLLGLGVLFGPFGLWYWSDWLPVFHFSLREAIYHCWCFFLYFLFKVPNYFWIGILLEFIFDEKVLQEDLLASLMGHWILALCCLYLIRFSDEGFVLNFLKVAWHSFMSLHSSVNHCLWCFRDIVVLGIILMVKVMRVLAESNMGSSWFVFVSGIGVVRQRFL